MGSLLVLPLSRMHLRGFHFLSNVISNIFNISMKEYEDMAIKIGDKVGIEINKVDSSGI